MKKMIALTLSLLIPQLASALNAGPLDGADFVVNCVSDKDGSLVTLARSGGTNKGYIVTDAIRGEATILSGIGSLTFLHLMEQDVITFVVDFDNLSYDLTIKGPHATQDHGACDDPIS